MKGHLRERPKGSNNWYAVLDMRDPATGKRKRKWHSLEASGKRQAQIECAGIISALQGGTYLEPAKITVAAHMERWLEHVRSQVSPKTFERYCGVVRGNIMPALGGIPLTKLQPAQISEAYAKALSTGRRDGKGGLSSASVLYMHRLLKEALTVAVGEWRLLSWNPAETVKAPKVKRKNMRALDTTETAALLEAARDYRLFIPVLLAVTCGLRRGEICALRWRNVELSDGAQLAVIGSIEQTKLGIREKEPKSGRARTVSLAALAVEELRHHKMRQAEELLRIGLRQSDDMYVVAQADGHLLRPHSLTHEFVRFIAGTTLPRVRFHDLRHSHATHLLASGVHPKIASERLGHATVAITLDLYSHVLPGMQADAASRVDEVLRQALHRHRGLAKG
jgi:integrase